MTSATLVVLSLEAWDGTWRRNQYLIDGLLRADPQLRVLFVEPARDLLHDAVSGRRPRRGAGSRTVPGYEGRLEVVEPTKWLPRAVGPAADALLRRDLSAHLRRLRATRPLLWVNDPGWSHLVAATGFPALYDITDDWTLADRDARALRRTLANEATLLRLCVAVVVCSEQLLAARRETRPDAVLIPNGVDVARYRRPSARPADLPPAPVALYVGTLHEDRLDVGAVIRTGAALAKQGGSCVLVGPNALAESNATALRSAPGVLTLGPRDFATVPAYLQHADALIVPHVVTAFTDSLDPIKRYEYLAVGVPIVSTPVAGFRELVGQPGVSIADADRFPDAVVTAVADPSRRSRTGVGDWSERVSAMAAQLDRLRSA